MITPNDFLQLAASLAANTSSEVHQRESIIASYYAAFHQCQQLASKLQDHAGMGAFAGSHLEIIKKLSEYPILNNAEQQQIVTRRVNGNNSLRSQVWARHNNKFKINSYHCLPASRFHESTYYLETMEIKGAESLPSESSKEIIKQVYSTATEIPHYLISEQAFETISDTRNTLFLLGTLALESSRSDLPSEEMGTSLMRLSEQLVSVLANIVSSHLKTPTAYLMKLNRNLLWT